MATSAEEEKILQCNHNNSPVDNAEVNRRQLVLADCNDCVGNSWVLGQISSREKVKLKQIMSPA